MSNWKVFKGKVELKPHPNADALCIVKVEDFQLVSSLSNGYVDGQVVIVMPDKTVINHEGMRVEEEKYLTGPKRNRVRTVQLRGEISQGATYPADKIADIYGDRIADLVEAAPLGEDISELLEMTKYEPPIPANMVGVLAPLPTDIKFTKHDVLQYGAYADEFDPDERVVITEKLHGTQINYTRDRQAGEFPVLYMESNGVPIHDWEKPIVPPVYTEIVSSKGVMSRALCLLEDEGNLYWQAVRNSGLRELADQIALANALEDEDITVSIHGEVVPAQIGFSYGQTKPIVKVFAVVINGWNVPYDTLLWVTDPVLHVRMDSQPEGNKMTTNKLLDWVPVLYDGPLKDADVYALAKGKEQVSGKELHIREGIVIRPYEMRRASDGEKLFVKCINPKYSQKETGEEVS